MKNLAVIPARSGSKGLKDKNIKLLNGKPLMVYSIEAAKKSEIFDCIHVSTDSEQYAKIAKDNGADVPFLREASLANDTSSTWDVIKYVLKKYTAMNQCFDSVTVLQPTSPLRSEKDIYHAYQMFVQKKAHAVISVCEMEHPPVWSNVLPEDGSLKGFLKPEADVRRQELPTYYRFNGAIYIVDVKHLLNVGDLYDEKSYAYVMDKRISVDIDTAYDFAMAEFMMNYT